MKFQNVKQIISVAIVATFALSCPRAQAATQQQLDNLSLDGVEAVYDYEFSNANTVMESCEQGAETYPIFKTSCNIQRMQWQNYFAQFRLYIQKRKLIERSN